MQELNEALEEFDDEEFGNIITDIESMSESDYSQEFFEICSNKGLRDRIIRFLQSQDKHDLVGLMEENEGFATLRNRLPKEITDDVVQLLANSKEAMQDFYYINSQNDVSNFNTKYGVNLILPPAVLA